ncbi:MAG: peptidoglycan-binding protein [Pseudarthrobacter sp.]|nr:peptidoglycan-binding protein [Pseudarthrobacter sp.]
MSALSAPQGSRPQLVSVQHVTSGPHRPSVQRTASRQNVVPVPAARGGKEQLPPLRLTRRGRVVLIGIPLVLLAALVFLLMGFLNAPAKAADSAADLALTPAVSVTVQAGESLWEIAGTVAPDRDARDVIADIVQLNNLTAANVMPGQQLFVPVK